MALLVQLAAASKRYLLPPWEDLGTVTACCCWILLSVYLQPHTVQVNSHVPLPTSCTLVWPAFL
jgi:hypothetical protein